MSRPADNGPAWIEDEQTEQNKSCKQFSKHYHTCTAQPKLLKKSRMLNDEERRPSNAHIVEALTRLADMLKNDKRSVQDPPHLSHYRELPHDVSKAYELLQQGAELIHGTATKYTLVGKIDETEQKKLGADLLSGCEILGAATHALHQDATGCSRAVRRATQRAALAVILSVIQLAASFSDRTALDENVGAQKTGAVWEACDKILNRLLPQGNRNAIRRELFTWTRETNDSMDEFQEMIDLGCSEQVEEVVGEELDDLFGNDDEKFSENDMPVAKACLGILKCSRGTMKLTLDACDDLGRKFAETRDEKYLDRIMQLHGCAQIVGEGVTDMGSLMYPPILPQSSDLESQVQEQVRGITSLLDAALGMDGLDSNSSELAHVLRVAVDTRKNEFGLAIAAGKQ